LKQTVCCLGRKLRIHLHFLPLLLFLSWMKISKAMSGVRGSFCAQTWNEQFKQHRKQRNNKSHTQTTVMFLGLNFMRMVLKRSYRNDKMRLKDK